MKFDKKKSWELKNTSCHLFILKKKSLVGPICIDMGFGNEWECEDRDNEVAIL